MIELNFTQYIEALNKQKEIARPVEHVWQNDDFIFMFFRSREKIDYYTIVDKDNIRAIGTVEDFLINYCSNALPIKEPPIWIPYKEHPLESQSTGISKAIDFDKLVGESKDYADFLIKMFDLFEKEVLKSVNKIDKKLNKNFGQFLTDLFNTVNTAEFAKRIKNLLKNDVNVGRQLAEKELKTDIVWNEAFDKKLAVLYSEQIDGYTINGKKWFGIKGVTKEIQQKVIQTVQSGISENKSNAEISKDVQKTFSGFTDWRSNMIARTETNRIHNESKILGYKESGMDGVKVWNTAPFESGRSSEICQRLKGQEQPLDNDFTDPETMKAFASPPSHPNCRSTITFRPF